MRSWASSTTVTVFWSGETATVPRSPSVEALSYVSPSGSVSVSVKVTPEFAVRPLYSGMATDTRKCAVSPASSVLTLSSQDPSSAWTFLSRDVSTLSVPFLSATSPVAAPQVPSSCATGATFMMVVW